MKNLKMSSALAFSIAILTLGCSKGSVGPTGPRGPAGPDSVIYSAWTSINLTIVSTSFYSQAIVASAITQRILDSGIILTYIGLPNGTSASDIAPASNFLSQDFVVDSIFLSSDTNLNNGLVYRYVVVPGSQQAGTMITGPAKGLTQEQLRTMAYADLVKILGIPAKSYGN
jgi:hypothetical protein